MIFLSYYLRKLIKKQRTKSLQKSSEEKIILAPQTSRGRHDLVDGAFATRATTPAVLSGREGGGGRRLADVVLPGQEGSGVRL
jgi:hypothetical protein